MNNIVSFTRFRSLDESDVRRTLMEDLMLDMSPAVWFKTIDSIIEAWCDECDH